MKQLDSALWYAQKGYDLGLQSKELKYTSRLPSACPWECLFEIRQIMILAENYFRNAIDESQKLLIIFILR